MGLDLSLLPKSWKAEQLKEAADFTRKPRGLTLPPSVRFVPMDLLPTTGVYATASQPRALNELTSGTYVEDGDVMVAKITPCFENGKQGILAVGSPFAYATTEVIPLRGRPEKTDTLFLHFLLLHPGLRAKLASQMEGSTNRQRLPKEVVEKAVVPVPPLDEQRQIAAVLSAVQRAIGRQERLIALSAELKKAFMHKLFTEGTRGEPLKQTETGLVPESWDVVPLGSLAKIGNGSTPKRNKVGYWENGSIPWLTSAKIHEGRIKKPDQYVTELAKAECHLPTVAAGNLLVAITGEGKTLGNAALVEFDTCVSQHLAYVQFHRSEVVPAFLLYFLQRQYAHLRQMSVGAGTTKKALTCGMLKRYVVPVPAKEEQKLIAGAIDAVVVKMDGHERTAKCLRSLFRTLLNQLMTARLRVHELDLAARKEASQPERSGLNDCAHNKRTCTDGQLHG